MVALLSHPAFWLVIGVILVIAEIFTLTFILLWIGIGAVVTGISAWIFPSMTVQFLVFSISSLLLLIYTRPLTQRWRNRTPNVQSGVYALIGKEAIVMEAIDPLQSGIVKVGGETWTAISEGVSIAKGTTVEIIEVQGVTLKVKAVGG